MCSSDLEVQCVYAKPSEDNEVRKQEFFLILEKSILIGLLRQMLHCLLGFQYDQTIFALPASFRSPAAGGLCPDLQELWCSQS